MDVAAVFAVAVVQDVAAVFAVAVVQGVAVVFVAAVVQGVVQGVAVVFVVAVVLAVVQDAQQVSGSAGWRYRHNRDRHLDGSVVSLGHWRGVIRVY